MTKDDIINMAKEAWGLEYVSEFDVPKLERFAALVADAEREACAEVASGLYANARADEIESAIRARSTT